MALDRLGLAKTTLIDFPGVVAATVFTAGCNLRCGYCHNPQLIPFQPPLDFVRRDEVIDHLTKRRAVLGGVCVTGGEPLLHPDLPDLLREIRTIIPRIKLDTNGMVPDRLRAVLDERLVDFVAIDLKTAPSRYVELGAPPSGDRRLHESIDIIRASGVDVEYRTTVAPPLVDPDDVDAILNLLRPGDRYVVAQFNPDTTFDPAFAQATVYPRERLEEIVETARSRGIDATLRA